MKKIEAIIRPSRLEEIKEALIKIDIRGITVTQVMGCGKQKGLKEYYRGTVVNLNLLPKMKIEIISTDEHAEDIIKVICEQAKTGEVGDGKIFVYNIDDTIRIRTGERGNQAV
jgi:nitrogen regulatory protein PII